MARGGDDPDTHPSSLEEPAVEARVLRGQPLTLPQPILTTRLPVRPRRMGDTDGVAQRLGIEAGVVVLVDQARTLLRVEAAARRDDRRPEVEAGLQPAR